MNKQTFHDLRIQSIEKETEGSSRIRFALPETLLDEFHFKPGQYISIKFEMKKKAHVRTYSISSEPDRNFIEIGVKHIKNGMFSKFLKTKNKLLIGSLNYLSLYDENLTLKNRWKLKND